MPTIGERFRTSDETDDNSAAPICHGSRREFVPLLFAFVRDEKEEKRRNVSTQPQVIVSPVTAPEMRVPSLEGATLRESWVAPGRFPVPCTVNWSAGM